jgi:hypothetical protein
MALNGAGRCPCAEGPNPCLSCKGGEGSTGAGSLIGVRPTIIHTRYKDDPVRDPGSRFNQGGYLRSGYDTGRGR